MVSFLDFELFSGLVKIDLLVLLLLFVHHLGEHRLVVKFDFFERLLRFQILMNGSAVLVLVFFKIDALLVFISIEDVFGVVSVFLGSLFKMLLPPAVSFCYFRVNSP